jgi:hypothetical protein
MESAANTRMRNHFLSLMIEVQKLNKAILKRNNRIDKLKSHCKVQYECIIRQNLQVADLKKQIAEWEAVYEAEEGVP